PAAATAFITPSLHDPLPTSFSSGSNSCAVPGSGALDPEQPDSAMTAPVARAMPPSSRFFVNIFVLSKPPHSRQVLSVSPLRRGPDRKSTRLNSSHVKISYAV